MLAAVAVAVAVREADTAAAAVQRDCLREAQAMEVKRHRLLYQIQGRQTLAAAAVAVEITAAVVQTAAVAL